MPKRGPSLLRGVLLWLGLLAACRAGASRQSETKRSATAVAAPRPATAEPLAGALGSPLLAAIARPEADAPAAQRERVHYALARHPERAELRFGKTQLFDFGSAGDARYRLGGWLGPASESRSFGETSALFTAGPHLPLTLPIEQAGSHALLMRTRSFGPVALQVTVNGRRLARRALAGKSFETLRFSVPGRLLERGEMSLELELLPTRGRASAVRSGFALDWVQLGPTSTPTMTALPPWAAFAFGLTDDERVRISSAASVSYTLQVPDAAVLRGTLHAARPAHLQVRACRDLAEPVVLAELAAGPAPTSFSVDLAALRGEVVRLELEADQADVVLDAPRVVTLEPATARLPTPAPARNLLIVLVDTLRPDRLAAYNPHTRVRTPGLGRFLPEAALMLDARAQENWTKPSVATLLTSLLPWQHHVGSDEAVLPPSAQTLAEVLRERGFYTGAFVANGYICEKFGFAQGFRDYRNYLHEGRPNVAQYVAADVLAWLDARPANQPFFLYVHTVDPHVPYKPPPHFVAMYDPAPYSGPIDFHGNHNLLEKIKAGTQPIDARDREHLLALYDAEVSYHDAYLGVILDGLKARGLDENTVVVITSDHGEEFWEHGSVGHGHTVFDELLHIPLIVHVPGMAGGGRGVTGDVGLVDVEPTVLQALGQSIPSTLSGQSFLPQLLGEQPDAPRFTVSGFMDGWRALATGRVKLVQQGLRHARLYDTLHDPGEHHDLAADHPITLRYAHALLGLALGPARGPGVGTALPVTTTDLDAATLAQLRSLGYTGTSRHRDAAAGSAVR
ncbi:MAG TPA: sulfatase [Polyangiales bacterium]